MFWLRNITHPTLIWVESAYALLERTCCVVSGELALLVQQHATHIPAGFRTQIKACTKGPMLLSFLLHASANYQVQVLQVTYRVSKLAFNPDFSDY